jgi:hypothetical protein
MIYTIEQQKQGAELMKTLVEKAWESATFKEQLISNPGVAIKEVTGHNFTIPENKRLVVEDQTDSSIIYLNIPQKVEVENLELTDEQLEMVSGGDFVIVPAAVGCGIGFVALCVTAYALFTRE